MEKSTLVFLVLGAVLATLLSIGHCQGYLPRCGKNMEWSNCSASCQETCDDVASMMPKVCDMSCKAGCVCNIDCALNGDQCIPKKDCPCKKNAAYKGCTNCRKTCEDVTNMGKPDEKMCTKECQLGCTCDEGYVFNSGQCILEKDCPCPAHAHYNECGTGCPLTCENHTAPASSYKACPTKCGKGCFCDDGYVKMGEKGTCVLPSACGYSG